MIVTLKTRYDNITPPWVVLFRPPDMVVGGLIFYQAFFFFFFFSFFRQLISELAERNSTIFGHMVGSECSLRCMSEI